MQYTVNYLHFRAKKSYVRHIAYSLIIPISIYTLATFTPCCNYLLGWLAQCTL